MEQGMNEGRETVKALRKKCLRARKKEKGTMLDHLVAEHGYNRKYAARLLSGWGTPFPEEERRGSKPQYEAVYGALKQIWQWYDYICSKRLKPVMQEAVRKMEDFHPVLLRLHANAVLPALYSDSASRAIAASSSCEDANDEAHSALSSISAIRNVAWKNGGWGLGNRTLVR